MDSIQELIKNRPGEPSQVSALKEYAMQNHGITIQVQSTAKYYLIRVPSAVLAHKFRLESPKITTQCQLDKKLVIHIGQ